MEYYRLLYIKDSPFQRLNSLESTEVSDVLLCMPGMACVNRNPGSGFAHFSTLDRSNA